MPEEFGLAKTRPLHVTHQDDILIEAHDDLDDTGLDGKKLGSTWRVARGHGTCQSGQSAACSRDHS